MLTVIYFILITQFIGASASKESCTDIITKMKFTKCGITFKKENKSLVKYYQQCFNSIQNIDVCDSCLMPTGNKEHFYCYVNSKYKLEDIVDNNEDENSNSNSVQPDDENSDNAKPDNKPDGEIRVTYVKKFEFDELNTLIEPEENFIDVNFIISIVILIVTILLSLIYLILLFKNCCKDKKYELLEDDELEKLMQDNNKNKCNGLQTLFKLMTLMVLISFICLISGSICNLIMVNAQMINYCECDYDDNTMICNFNHNINLWDAIEDNSVEIHQRLMTLIEHKRTRYLTAAACVWGDHNDYDKVKNFYESHANKCKIFEKSKDLCDYDCVIGHDSIEVICHDADWQLVNVIDEISLNYTLPKLNLTDEIIDLVSIQTVISPECRYYIILPNNEISCYQGSINGYDPLMGSSLMNSTSVDNQMTLNVLINMDEIQTSIDTCNTNRDKLYNTIRKESIIISTQAIIKTQMTNEWCHKKYDANCTNVPCYGENGEYLTLSSCIDEDGMIINKGHQVNCVDSNCKVSYTNCVNPSCLVDDAVDSEVMSDQLPDEPTDYEPKPDSEISILTIIMIVLIVAVAIILIIMVIMTIKK